MKLIHRLCDLFGYELTASRKSPTLHSHLTQIFNRYGIDVVLDVGANEGQFATMLRKKGYQGQINSFEPVTQTYERLSAVSAHDYQWHAFQLGLGNVCGNKSINISESSDLNSFLNANEFGKTNFPKIDASRQEIIEIDTLDAFLEKHNIPHSANIFLKMDTQGYDLRVFEGAKGSLHRIAGLLSEISMIPIYEGCPHYLKSLETFEKEGFMISGLYPVSRTGAQTIIEMDCVLINTRRSPAA